MWTLGNEILQSKGITRSKAIKNKYVGVFKEKKEEDQGHYRRSIARSRDD